MKKNYGGVLLLLVVLIIIILLFLPKAVGAGPELPEGLGVFYLDTGHACVYNKSSLEWDCYCPCYQGWCVDNTIAYADDVDKPTPVPPEPTPIPPIPTEETKCNSGRGNGSEGEIDCDPGNSGDHNQGGD